MGTPAIATESATELLERLWRDAALNAWNARREYEALTQADEVDERAVELSWLKLWRADRACEELLAQDNPN